MATPGTSHSAGQQNDVSSPSFLRSAPLIVDYLAQLRFSSFSDDASRIRLNLEENQSTKLASDAIFDAIDQLVIKANGAFQSASERTQKVKFQPPILSDKDPKVVIVDIHYDYFSVDRVGTHPALEGLEQRMKDLVASLNEVKDEFVVVHTIAKDIKYAVINVSGTVQGQQHETSADRSQVDQSTSGATIVHDLQIQAQHALESLQKVIRRLDQDPEQPEFDNVGLKAPSGLENELSSIVGYFQTLSVQLDGMSEEMTQKMIDLHRSEAVHDRPAADTRDLFMQCARYVDATGVEFSLVDDFMSNFVIPPMQRIESLGRHSDSEQWKTFNKYYREAMKGYTQATGSLAEKSSNEILASLKAGISVVDMDKGQRTREVSRGDEKKTEERTAAGNQGEGDHGADDSYGDEPMLGTNTEVFGTDEGGESEAARKLSQSAARVTKMFDNEIGLAGGQFDHKVFE